MKDHTKDCIKNLCYIKNKVHPSLEKLSALVIAKAQNNTQDYEKLTKYLLKKKYKHITDFEINSYINFVNSKIDEIYNEIISGNKILDFNKSKFENWGDKRIYSKYHLLLQRPNKSTFAVIFQESKDLKILESSKRLGYGKESSILAGKFFKVFQDINEICLISINPNSGTKKNNLKYIYVKRKEVDLQKVEEALINKEKNCYLCEFKQICEFQNSLPLLKGSQIKEESNVSASWKMPILNKEQKEVSLITKGVSRVNAVPGSGKTTTLIELGKNLLLKGYSGDDIIFMSFTNNGVKELKTRFNIMASEVFKSNLLLLNEALRIDFLSYNSLGNLIISELSKDNFFEPPKILNKVDSLIILQKIIENNLDMDKLSASYEKPFSNKNPTGVCVYLLYEIEVIKRNIIEHMAKNEIYEINPDIKFYYDEYEKEKRKENYFDYNDQIITLMDYLKEHTLPYKVVIVDEFQDSNKAHISILKSMFKTAEMLIVVGDDSQAIFGFNNVYPENMINFDKLFKNAKDYKITTNYRSCEKIVTASNLIIEYSENRIPKTINGVKSGGIIENIPIGTRNDIVDFYSQNIPRDKRTLILCGNNHDCEMLSSEFTNKKVSVSLEYSLMKDMLYALMNLFSAIILNEKKYVLFALSILKLKKLEDIKQDELDTTFKKLMEIKNQPNSYFKLRQYYFQLSEIYVNFDVFDLLDNKNINEIEAAFTYLRIYLESSTSERKSIISKDTDNKKDEIPIRISTFHNAKGSEYDIVIINGLSLRKTNKLPITDEDIRLLYVGFTRAIEKLYLLHSSDLSEEENTLEFYAYESIEKAKASYRKKAV